MGSNIKNVVKNYEMLLRLVIILVWIRIRHIIYVNTLPWN